MMSGAAARHGYGYDAEWQISDVASGPMAKALVGGYRKDTLNGLWEDGLRYGHLNTDRPRSSALVDLQDPIQVHLLTETALSDGQAYQILSQEEVDDLKKRIQSLSMRVDQARSNLAIQTKYRDAAVSMAKLYASSRPNSKTSSLVGNRLSGSESAREADMERQMSEQRCEELATELFSFEKRMIELQRRLLEHTAGILQLTHGASKMAGTRPAQGQAIANGIPGSPESLFTYSNPRDSSGFLADDISDEQNLYLPPDPEEQPGRSLQGKIEIPLRSPVREQATQLRELHELREEMDRLKDDTVRQKEKEGQLAAEIALLRERERELATADTERSTGREEELSSEITRLKEREQQLRAEAEDLDGKFQAQLKIIEDTEGKLQTLNMDLRKVVVKFNPPKNGDYTQPEAAIGSGKSLGVQLEFLAKAISTIAEEQDQNQQARDAELKSAASASAASASLAQANSEQQAELDRLQAVEGRIKVINDQVTTALRKVNPEQPAAPETDPEAQLDFLQESRGAVEDELSRFADLTSSVSASRQNNTQAEAVLMGLWDIIQTGLAELQKQRARRRQTLTAQGLDTDDEDDELSGQDWYNPNETYSLQAFSTKVQWFYALATSMAEQKAALRRQLKQQRELNSKTDTEKDEELKKTANELVKTRALLETFQHENEASVASLQSQLRQVEDAKKVAETSAQQLQASMTEKDEELDRMSGMVVELKTELTFAKAELDGAYGSRKQRAAEVAKLSNSGDTAELNEQVEKLKSELASTIRELEAITKETLQAEKDRLDIENKLDDALMAKSTLEAEAQVLRDRLDNEVSRLQEQLDAEKLKVPTSPKGAGGVRAGTSMLSEQFRTTMKEERKKFQEELKEEQAKRRKLEDDIRALKKAQGR